MKFGSQLRCSIVRIPKKPDFSKQEIVQRAAREHPKDELRPGLSIHISQHCVAAKAPNPGNYRILTATDRGRYRLFRQGDPCHPDRTGKITPEASAIPERYHDLLDWYTSVYSPHKKEHRFAGIFRMIGAGRGSYGDPDEFVRKLREGWD